VEIHKESETYIKQNSTRDQIMHMQHTHNMKKKQIKELVMHMQATSKQVVCIPILVCINERWKTSQRGNIKYSTRIITRFNTRFITQFHRGIKKMYSTHHVLHQF
jgi:lipopolysaccharide/colanic/teichoic acid biosynthesis glycosyltransferase